jgi:sigma-B regulation protein RsbU (phosphoserine phosphatase)
MSLSAMPIPPDKTSLPLEQQVVRLQALLEASRLVHSTIELPRVLQQAARIAVLELEMDGAMFTEPEVIFGEVPEDIATMDCAVCPRFPLLAKDGSLLCELVVVPPSGRELTLYETDFLEGLALQTAVAVENAINHQRHMEYARLARDIDAARTIQQGLLPQSMPNIPGYQVAARNRACYQVGGDYFDVVVEPDGSLLIVVADVAGKGLASALICTAFRSAFRALAKQSLTLKELAARLSQQHWEEGEENRRRYVTAAFVRLDAAGEELEVVNAGHNPVFLILPDSSKTIEASGAPLGLLTGNRYVTERLPFPKGARLLLYTDGLTEVVNEHDEEDEFGSERLMETFRATEGLEAEDALSSLWGTLDEFSGHAPQVDDMTAVALYHLNAGVR